MITMMHAITPTLLAETAAALKVAAMLVFLALFIGVIVRLVMTRSSTHEQAAQIPLHDDVVTPRDGDPEGSKP